MSLESGKKSAAEMRAAQRERLSQAETATPAVVVTEKNWAAMIDSQKMQIKTLGEIQEYLDTLTTEKQLLLYMDRQLEILREDGQTSREAMEQYRQTLTREAQNTTASTESAMKSLERQVGNMSEEFGRSILQEQERMKNTSKKLFWISMIPSLILVIWELTRHVCGCGLHGYRKTFQRFFHGSRLHHADLPDQLLQDHHPR